MRVAPRAQNGLRSAPAPHPIKAPSNRNEAFSFSAFRGVHCAGVFTEPRLPRADRRGEVYRRRQTREVNLASIESQPALKATLQSWPKAENPTLRGL
jgi:hypothetical protein